MSDIVRRTQMAQPGQIVRVNRAASRDLQQISNQAVVAEAQEFVLARLAQLRIDAGNQLARRTVFDLKTLHSLVTELTRDNPGLEMELRSFASIVAVASQQIIADYMMRPL